MCTHRVMECREIEENDNEDSFIEIEVDPWSSNEVDDDEKDKSNNNNNNNNLKLIESSNNGEFELLRISISSTINPIIPLPLLHHHHHSNTSIVEPFSSNTCAFHPSSSSSSSPAALVNCTTNSSSPLNNNHSGPNQPRLLNVYANNMDLRYSTRLVNNLIP